MEEILLAISSNSREIYNYAEKLNETNSQYEIIAWVIVLVAVIAACVFFSLGWPKLSEKLKQKKEEKKSTENAENQKAELDRLHKIKEQNKRK